MVRIDGTEVVTDPWLSGLMRLEMRLKCLFSQVEVGYI